MRLDTRNSWCCAPRGILRSTRPSSDLCLASAGKTVRSASDRRRGHRLPNLSSNLVTLPTKALSPLLLRRYGVSGISLEVLTLFGWVLRYFSPSTAFRKRALRQHLSRLIVAIFSGFFPLLFSWPYAVWSCSPQQAWV